MENELLKETEDIQWERRTGCRIEDQIVEGRCLHTHMPFDGRWYAIHYAILSDDRVIWWYLYGDQLQSRLSKVAALRTRKQRIMAKLREKYKPAFSKECPYCGEDFETTNEKKIYCSKACGYRQHLLRKAEVRK